MLSNKVTTTLFQRVNKVNAAQIANAHYFKKIIGKREIVGPGVNDIPHYYDRIDFPFPSIRFREIKGDIAALREKEKGDWKNLTIAEKKALYRASFCQTFSEMESPTGEWKQIMGLTLFMTALGIWATLFVRKYVRPPLPDSLSEENRRALLREAIDLKTGPVTGIASYWDYEKDDWKK